MSGLTLDTGALIALERGEERIRALLRAALEKNLPISIPAGVLAQAWRGGPRAARISRLLKDREHVDLVVLDEQEAFAIGEVAKRCGHPDIVDIHVALCARRRNNKVVTSDAADIQRVDAKLPLVPL